MKLAFWLILLSLCGCATAPSSDLDEIQAGMDKDQVLNLAGGPRRTFRTDGQDHWIYVFFHEDQEWIRQVDFSSGRVVKVGRPVSKLGPERALEEADSMEEYEARVRDQKRRSRKFKDIDGDGKTANER